MQCAPSTDAAYDRLREWGRQLYFYSSIISGILSRTGRGRESVRHVNVAGEKHSLKSVKRSS